MLKHLFRCIRGYKLQTVLTPVLMIGEVVCECIIPVITARLINSINAGCEMNEILKYGLMLVLMAFTSLAFGVLAGKTAATASAGFAKNLRHDIFYKIQDFSFLNIDRFSTSSLVTRLTTDITNVQMAFMMIIRTAVRAPLMLIFATVMASVVGKKLSLIFVFIAPALAIGLLTIGLNALPRFRAVFKKYDKLNNSVQENIKGMRVVKSFVREEYEKEKFAVSSENIRDDFTNVERIIALNGPLMQLAMYTSMLLISFFTAKLVVSTGGTYLDVGTLSSMITYSMQVLMSLMMLSMIFVMITMAIASTKRITEVLEEIPDITEKENPVTVVPDGSIDFNNVSFKYSKNAENYALSDINIHIDSGETVGIIGGTGSSKTTLIQLISRLYDATEGSVLVGGTDVREYGLKELRDAVSVVLQKNVLFSGTIKENLRWGDPDASDEEIERICKLSQASEFIEGFPDKYDTYIEQGGANVSGGQKQRLCIARALLKKPKILILDDSTSAVDTKTDALIRKAFREEIPGTTKIIIAQRISSVQDADKIIVLDNGRIDGMGTHEELLETNEIYKEAYSIQMKAGEEDE
ncbi:MAG: ABC transporter ATP-binding protein [Ruminococcaceae bacterium]|nr:ABC transporter ATP-binding protein [Oscillospiraceae bacterium]